MTDPTRSLISDQQLADAVAWYFDRGRPDWDFEQPSWEQLCRLYLERLEPLAEAGHHTIAYSELVRGSAIDQHPAWRYILSDQLETLVKVCVDAQLPIITALVTYKGGRPGRGFFDAAMRFNRHDPQSGTDERYWFDELARVHERWARRQG